MLFISEFYFFVLLVLNFLFHFPVAGSELVYQVSFKSNSSVLIRYPRLLARGSNTRIPFIQKMEIHFYSQSQRFVSHINLQTFVKNIFQFRPDLASGSSFHLSTFVGLEDLL